MQDTSQGYLVGPAHREPHIDYPNPLGIRIGNDSNIMIGKDPRNFAEHVNPEYPTVFLNDMEPQSAEYCTEEEKKEFNFQRSIQEKAKLMAKINAQSQIKKHPKQNVKPQSVDDILKDLSIVSGPTEVQRKVKIINTLHGSNALDVEGRKEVETLSSGLDSLGAVNLNLDFEPTYELIKSSPMKSSECSGSSSPLDDETHGSIYTTNKDVDAHKGPRTDAIPLPPATLSGKGPTALQLQRLRSYRKTLSKEDISKLGCTDEEEDLKRVKELPDDALKLIKYTDDSPWLGSEISVDPESPAINSAMSTPTSLSSIDAGIVYRATAVPLQPVAEIGVHKSFSESQSDCLPQESQALTESTSIVAPRKISTIEQSDPVLETDRGRLFLQINKISNLKGLPIDTTRCPKFILTLNNGQQTVDTDSCPLPTPGTNSNLMASKIGQEFELTVGKDLELTITMSVSMNPAHRPPHLDQPLKMKTKRTSLTSPVPSTPSERSIHSMSSSSASPKKSMKNIFSRNKGKKHNNSTPQQHVGANTLSNKDTEEARRKESEDIERENANMKRQREKDIESFRKRSEIWNGITGPKGEYCRGYLVESHYERDVYGKAKTFNLSLYNEWDVKTTSSGVPKPVCDLQVTMMFVPKLYGSEVIPRSLALCQEALQSARTTDHINKEGFLTQQGGDCTIWRRRWFKLECSEMIGYHESSGKKRTVIHLENVVDVKEKLDDDLWCVYEDRAFQITFDDGEAVAFYADTIEDRISWVKALTANVGYKTSQRKAWTDLVFEHSST